MVLPRSVELPVGGTADPGEKVTVSFGGATAETSAGADGRWSVRLPAMEASSAGRVFKVNDIEIKDVLVGEVWFCAGQSNTEMPLVGSPHFMDREGLMMAQLIDEPLIRYAYCADYDWSPEPKREYTGEFTEWKEFNHDNLMPPHSFSAMGVYFALQIHRATKVPVGIVGTYWGGTNIDAWTPREGYENCPDSIRDTAEWKIRGKDELEGWQAVAPIYDPWQQPTVLFNEMVAPWTPFAIKGFIWYQGCHNAGEAWRYCDKMHALYDGWSKVFENPSLKLYFVQLAPWKNSWWDIQLQQEKFADEEPNAGMAVSCDVGNIHDIHPNEKRYIGDRLAALAMKRDYGFDSVIADYPRVSSMRREGNSLVLSVPGVSVWRLYNPDWSVEVPFEVCGADGVWKKAWLANSNGGRRAAEEWVTNGEVAGSELVVVSDEVAEPVAVRYLHEFPWRGALFADSGLPLAPFEKRLD